MKIPKWAKILLAQAQQLPLFLLLAGLKILQSMLMEVV